MLKGTPIISKEKICIMQINDIGNMNERFVLTPGQKKRKERKE